MDQMSQRTLRLCAAMLAAGAAVGTTTVGAAGTAPEPVPASDFRLVIKDVTILDAAGAAIVRHHCEWTEPQEDDRPCMTFSGDPQNAYEAIKGAGGSSATVATKVPDLELDLFTRIRERADGTWLFRTAGVAEGKPFHAGWVCSADGRTCSQWRASSKRGAKRAIRAASARVERRAR